MHGTREQLSPVRTSHQCWGTRPDFLAHPTIRAITERINGLTMTPQANAEFFQVGPRVHVLHAHVQHVHVHVQHAHVHVHPPPPCTPHPTRAHGNARAMSSQVVRYEVSQFYKVHHDQNSAPFTPQGARLYTFFMYLNTPEAGGGTRFNDLGLP